MDHFTYNKIVFATNRLSVDNLQRAKENYKYNLFWDKVNRSPSNFNYAINDLTEKFGQELLGYLDNLNNYRG